MRLAVVAPADDVIELFDAVTRDNLRALRGLRRASRQPCRICGAVVAHYNSRPSANHRRSKRHLGALSRSS